MHGRALALAIDLGGTKVDAALVDADGAVVAGTVHRAPTGRDAEGRDRAGRSADVAAAALAGVWRRGPPDRNRNRLGRPGRPRGGAIAPLNLPGLAGLPIVALVQELARTSRCASRSTARASLWPSTGGVPPSARRNALAMVVSTGVGGGLIIDGAPVTGMSGNAGHIGQLRLRERAAGAPATDGTLEALASGPVHGRLGARAGVVGLTGEELAERLRRRRSDRGRRGAPLGRSGRRGDRERRDAARPRGRGDRGRLRTGRGRLPRPGARVGEGCRGLRLRASSADRGIRPRRPRPADRRGRARPALSRPRPPSHRRAAQWRHAAGCP